jgi:hypothetical protein
MKLCSENGIHANRKSQNIIRYRNLNLEHNNSNFIKNPLHPPLVVVRDFIRVVLRLDVG